MKDIQDLLEKAKKNIHNESIFHSIVLEILEVLSHPAHIPNKKTVKAIQDARNGKTIPWGKNTLI